MDSKFSFTQFPKAFLEDNNAAKNLRQQLFTKKFVAENKDSPSILSTVFFSDENIELINKQLMIYVYNETDGDLRISPQSKDSLLIAMRWVYDAYARNLPFKIKEQIKDLNNYVIEEIGPRVISNCEQKINYLNEISSPKKLLPLPENVNKLGKTLPSLTENFYN